MQALQRRPAVRPVRHAATGGRPACPSARPEDSPALGFLGLSPVVLERAEARPKTSSRHVVAEEWEERIDALGRDLPGPDAGLRPLPRSQVRSDHAAPTITRLAGVLASTRLVDRARVARGRRRKRCSHARERVAALEAKRSRSWQAQTQPRPKTNKTKLEMLRSQIADIEAATPQLRRPLALCRRRGEPVRVCPTAQTVPRGSITGPAKRRTLQLQIRGNPSNPGAGRAAAVSHGALTRTNRRRSRTGSGRLDLAEAIIVRGGAVGGAGDRQSRLEASLRPRHGGHSERLRRPRRAADASRTARRSGGPVHRQRLVAQMAASRDACSRPTYQQASGDRPEAAQPTGQQPAVANEPRRLEIEAVARRHAGRRRAPRRGSGRAVAGTGRRRQPPPHALRHRRSPRVARPAAAVRLPRSHRPQPRPRSDNYTAATAFRP